MRLFEGKKVHSHVSRSCNDTLPDLSFDFRDGCVHKLGRLDFVEFVPASKITRISREHCQFVLDASHIILLKNMSGNGTWVNSIRIGVGNSVALQTGDVVAFLLDEDNHPLVEYKFELEEVPSMVTELMQVTRPYIPVGHVEDELQVHVGQLVNILGMMRSMILCCCFQFWSKERKGLFGYCLNGIGQLGWVPLANLGSVEICPPDLTFRGVDPGRIFVVAIGQTDYENEKRPLLGTENDLKQMRDFWTQLGSKVVSSANLTADSILEKLRDVRKFMEASNQYDLFVFYFSGHGSKGCIFGVDNKSVPIGDITSMFDAHNFYDFRNKPKLLIWDCCRGKEHEVAQMKGVESPRWIGKNANFVHIYSTVEGTASFGQGQGGVFTSRFLESMRTCSSRRIDDIVAATNTMMGSFESLGATQTAQIINSLNNECLFYPLLLPLPK